MRQRMKTFGILAIVAGLTAVLTYGLVTAQTPHRTDGVLPIKMGPPPQPRSLVTLLQAMRDRTLGQVGLTYGSSSAGLLRWTDTFDYTINGIVYQVDTRDNIADSISGTALTNTQSCIFRVEIDSARAVTTVQGPIVTTASADPPLPPRSANKATLGWIKVVDYTFTPGTTTLNNAAVTFTNGDPDLTESLLATP